MLSFAYLIFAYCWRKDCEICKSVDWYKSFLLWSSRLRWVNNSFNFLLFLNFFYYCMAPDWDSFGIYHWLMAIVFLKDMTCWTCWVLSYSCQLYLGMSVSCIQYKPSNVLFDSSIISLFFSLTTVSRQTPTN